MRRTILAVLIFSVASLSHAGISVVGCEKAIDLYERGGFTHQQALIKAKKNKFCSKAISTISFIPPTLKFSPYQPLDSRYRDHDSFSFVAAGVKKKDGTDGINSKFFIDFNKGGKKFDFASRS